MIKKIFAASLALIAFSANASLINFTAIGDGNIAHDWNEGLVEADFVDDPAANFFKVTFTQGGAGEFITQLSFDLRAGSDEDAYFDPSDGYADPDITIDGDTSGKGFGPIIGDDTDGLSSSEVSFSLDTTSGINPILSIIFSAGSFINGETLSFGIDIDQLDEQNEDIGGGLLGTMGAGITATIGGSCEAEASTAFENVNNNSSQAALQLCGSQPSSANVPTPSSYLLMLAGFFALARSRKKVISAPA